MVTRDSALMRSPDAALQYWRGKAVPVSLVSPEACRRVKPRFLDRCGPGALVYATVPVRNWVCRTDRDGSVEVQLHYDDKDRLARFGSEMKPYRSLPLPFSDTAIHWAR